MIWTYPHADHPRLQRLWRIVHWRRQRRLERYIEEQLREQFDNRLREELRKIWEQQ